MNSGIIRLHVAPYKGFKGLYLPDVNAGVIRDWMLWEIEGGVSGIRINKALQAMRVPMRYAISRDELKRDPFEKVKEASVEQIEKGVLAKNEVIKLLEMRNGNKTDHLAVLLGVLCGMRLGEVRGLHWEDIQKDVITIRHNWQDMEGIKAPKFDSERTVPLPNAITAALKGMPRASALIFGRPDGKPLCNAYFRNALNRELSLVGIPGDWLSRKDKPPGYVNEQRSRNISFHSLRHTYVTLGRMAGISDIEIQVLAGHKSGAMMEHYSHVGQVIDYGAARKKMEAAFEGG
jgi:integrase